MLRLWLLVNPLEDLLISALDAAGNTFILSVLRATDRDLVLMSIYDIESRKAVIQI